MSNMTDIYDQDYANINPIVPTEFMVAAMLGCTMKEFYALSEDDQLDLVRHFANTCVPANEAQATVLDWIARI